MVWDTLNHGQLQRDVANLFQRHGVVVERLNCHMLGTTRTWVCTMGTREEQRQRLVHALNLQEPATIAQTDDGPLLDLMVETVGHGCLAKLGAHRATLHVYLSPQRRAAVLYYSAGQGAMFEYLSLFQPGDADNVCVQGAYAYS